MAALLLLLLLLTRRPQVLILSSWLINLHEGGLILRLLLQLCWIKLLVLLTKSDKLTRAEGAKALSIARLNAGGGEAMLFSALKKQGMEQVAQLLWDWTHPPQEDTAADDAEAADDGLSTPPASPPDAS